MTTQGSTGWHAGTAAFDITLPLGVELCGFADRPGPASHVWDPLAARALALWPEGEPPVALVSLDLLTLSPSQVAHIRWLLQTIVPAERLLLNCSHTHAGPATAELRAMGTPDTAYCELVCRLTASAVQEAIRRSRPARLSFGTAVTAIGVNRREWRDGRIVLGENASGPYDAAVRVLRVEDLEGRPLACWFSHAAHPVTMGGQNTGISAEWPGAAAGAVSSLLGCPALFAQGCSGDVNPVRRGSVDVVRILGRELAGSVIIAWERAQPLESARVAAGLARVPLPLRRPSAAEAEAILAACREEHDRRRADPSAPAWRRRQAAAFLDWATAYRAAADAPEPPTVSMELQVVRLGECLLIGTAAETFSSIGQSLVALSAAPHAAALGYTNGCIGYLPVAAAHAEGGYEVEIAHRYYATLPVAPEAEALTLSSGARLVEATA
jgi:neutral ceramidase